MIDLSSFITNVVTVGILYTCLGFLLRNLIITRLTKSVELESAKSLEEYKSKLKGASDNYVAELANLKKYEYDYFKYSFDNENIMLKELWHNIIPIKTAYANFENNYLETEILDDSIKTLEKYIVDNEPFIDSGTMEIINKLVSKLNSSEFTKEEYLYTIPIINELIVRIRLRMKLDMEDCI